jgi:hypothetical protein
MMSMAVVGTEAEELNVERQLSGNRNEVSARPLYRDRPFEEILSVSAVESDQGLAVLLEDPVLALWATENARRYRVSPVFMLGVLGDLLEKELRR